MKLQELESKTKAQQNQHVFESYFGQRLDVSAVHAVQAQHMLRRVRGLIREHRQTQDFHTSEQNPAYLKLVMMEQMLAARVKESSPGAAPGMALAQNANKPQAPGEPEIDPQSMMAGVRKIATATGQQNRAGVLGKAIDTAVQGKPLNPMQRTELGKQLGGLQKAMSNPQMANRLQQMLKTATAENSHNSRGLREANELQQAQVVLAAQDMVDQIQSMIEDVSSMQFKDLPALVNSIRNDIGMEQAQQFNNDSTAALQTLIQGLQGTKTQLETAQAVITGQAPMIPGTEPMPADTADSDMAADLALDANLADEEPDAAVQSKSLGRERR